MELMGTVNSQIQNKHFMLFEISLYVILLLRKTWITPAFTNWKKLKKDFCLYKNSIQHFFVEAVHTPNGENSSIKLLPQKLHSVA